MKTLYSVQEDLNKTQQCTNVCSVVRLNGYKFSYSYYFTFQANEEGNESAGTEILHIVTVMQKPYIPIFAFFNLVIIIYFVSKFHNEQVKLIEMLQSDME